MNTNKILKLLKRPLKIDELKKFFPQTSKKELLSALDELMANGEIVKNKKNRYALSSHFGCVSGTFLSTSRGFSFVEPDEKKDDEKDIYIPAGASLDAWHGDHVLVKLTNTRTFKGKKGQEGEVIKILKRATTEVIGSIRKQRKSFILVPNSNKYPTMLIPKAHMSTAMVGDSVAAKIMFYGDRRVLPQASVTQVFGKNGAMKASIAAILHENGITVPFPEEVLSEAKSFGDKIPPNSIHGRKDLRDELIFTIDGDDAQDFDDAVSLEKLQNGNLLLGVHIADVSHYVTKGSQLDNEAFYRGTSVYYPGHVVPMLPFELSAGLCSLRPNEDRLAFSVFMELKPNGQRVKSHFYKSVICSKARMTYRNVNLILNDNKELCEKYSFLVDKVKEMGILADTLHKRRIARGALELDIPEPEILTDETGEPVSLSYRARERAERMIEEFMLIANETVAEYMERNNYPTVYRVHENPDPQKLRVFAQFAKPFGHKIDASKPNDTHQFQLVLEAVKNDPKQKALPTLLLRSLARARYCDENLGHYGLQAKYYLHFTSPIRRYPDLITHRMLTRALENDTFTTSDIMAVDNAASQSTTRELAADNAERTIDRLYIAAYMEKFLGEVFDAEISGVQSFGVFVTLENSAEGLVRIEALSGYYEYDEERMQLIGKNGVKLTMGTPMKVRLIRADRISGQIDFAPAAEQEKICQH